MPSSAYSVIREAIANKRQVVATYDGYVREMCPHCIGLDKDGYEQALFFQFGGGSKKGLPPGGQWRCLSIGALSNISVRDGAWHTAPADHSRPQTCVKSIDLAVAY